MNNITPPAHVEALACRLALILDADNVDAYAAALAESMLCPTCENAVIDTASIARWSWCSTGGRSKTVSNNFEFTQVTFSSGVCLCFDSRWGCQSSRR